jgi:hypothetical protein
VNTWAITKLGNIAFKAPARFVFEAEWFDIGMLEDYAQVNKVPEGIFQ